MPQYKLQGEIDFQGLKIKIENRKNSTRKGIDEDGNEWKTKMEYPYGYISRTEGTDGDEVDCFVGDQRDSQKVFIVHTQNPETGKYDEDKVMLGFNSEQEARDVIARHYDSYTFIQSITTMSITELKEKLNQREGKMLKSINQIVRLIKAIKVPDLMTLDLFAQNRQEEAKEGETVTKDGKTYSYKRSKKNPSVLRLFRDDQTSLFGGDEQKPEPSNKVAPKKPKPEIKAFGETLNLFGDSKADEDIEPMKELSQSKEIKNEPQGSDSSKVEPDNAEQKPDKKIKIANVLKRLEQKAERKKKFGEFYNTVYGQNYRNLHKAIPFLDEIKVGDHYEMRAGESYMPLHVEGYGKDSNGRLIISLAHTYTQEGDLMSDPEMLIAIDKKNQVIEALSYQNDGMSVYSEVYDNWHEPKKVNIKEKKGQNSFLKTWIKNITNQGYQLEVKHADGQPEPEEEPIKPDSAIENIRDNQPEPTHGKASEPTTENIEYEEVKGKKKREDINEQVKELLASKQDHEFTKEDKQLLIKYTGRGGLKKGDTITANEDLDDISLNEFYTLPSLTEFMWKSLYHLGFNGGRVLEPSSGTGNFLYTAPDQALVTAVEYDTTSGRIADILYGSNHDVRVESYEQFNNKSEGGEFQAVIGNCPFGIRGETIAYDKRYQDLEKHEQYFIESSIDNLEEGGLLAMIVPTGIMDNQINSWRLRINKKAEFLGAVRLPTGAFKHADAQVTTDIVYFRKRPNVIAERMNNLKEGELNKLLDEKVLDGEFIYGKYFKENPQYALGKEKDGMYGTKIWVGDLNMEELNKMPTLLKQTTDDYNTIFPDVTTTKKDERTLNVGDIKNLNGRIYRLNENHRWERINESDLDKYTDVPPELKEKLGITNLAELNELGDVANMMNLTREQIGYLSTSLASQIQKELALHTAPSDHRDEMLKKAVVLGMAIKDYQRKLQNGELSVSDAQREGRKLGQLVKDFMKIYGHPIEEAKLTKYIGKSKNNPVMYVAGAVDSAGTLNKIFTDPFAFQNVYTLSNTIGELDRNSLHSIVQYLFNNHTAGTLDAIKGLYDGIKETVKEELLQADDIYIDENGNFAPLHEVCMGEVFNKLDSWQARRREIADELSMKNVGERDKQMLELEDKKLENQIFELKSRAEYKDIEDLPVLLSDAGKIFDIKILNEYLEQELGSKFADKVVWKESMRMYVPATGILEELYLLYANKGGLDAHEKNRLKHLLKLYFPTDDNPFFLSLLNRLNGIGKYWIQDVNKKERLKQEFLSIEDNFKNFLKGLPNADELTDIYNRTYNNYIFKQFDSTPIENLSKFAYDRVIATTPDGREVTAREKAGEHTWSTVRRMYEQGKGMIAHGVGLGKTLEAIVLTLLHKETGKANKPLIVTPKSVLKNWVNEINKWTEGVNYIVVGMKEVTDPKTGEKKWVEESRDEKELKLQQIATNSYDMILMSRDTFRMIDFSEKTKKAMLNELVSKYLPEPSGNNKLAKKRYEQATQNLAKVMTVEDAFQNIYMENLGIDMLVRDEAHDCKNLLVPVEETISGVNASMSQRAIHNLFASKVFRNQNNEGAIFSLTATPISNSPLEVFNMLLPIAEKELEKLQIANMDDFINKFALRDTEPYTDADGRVIQKERFAGWKSPEVLRKLFFRFTDFKTKDDVQSVKANIKFPNEKPNHIFSDLNAKQKELMKHCQLRLWTVRYKTTDDRGDLVLNEERIGDDLALGFISEGDVESLQSYFNYEYVPLYKQLNSNLADEEKPIDDNYFSIQADMIKIASDLTWYAGKDAGKNGRPFRSIFGKEILEEEAQQHADTEKLKQLEENVMTAYKNNGKQLIFAINTRLHDKIFKRLVDAGIPADEIKIVNGMTVKDSIKRAQISEDYNNGKYKVIIGNYATMGEGLNFNKMTSDIHHLQPTWNYLQIEQGNGRGIRQGNDLDFVNGHYYLAKGSIDAFMNQKIQEKGGMVAKFLRGDTNEWNADVNLTPEDMMIALAENPEVAKRMLEAKNIALQNAVKEKQRVKGYRGLEQLYDAKFRLSKIQDQKSKQYEQLSEEMKKMEDELFFNKEFPHKNAMTFDQRPIIMADKNAIVPVGSVLKYGSSDDSFAVLKDYTHSTGRVELEIWNTEGTVETKILKMKDFANQYGQVIHTSGFDLDVSAMFNHLINEKGLYHPSGVRLLPPDILKQYKKNIINNIRKSDTYTYVAFRNMDGDLKFLPFEDAEGFMNNEGGKFVFPQEEVNFYKELYQAIENDNYKAKRYAQELFGNDSEKQLKRIITPKKELASKYAIPVSGDKFVAKLGALKEKGHLGDYNYKKILDGIRKDNPRTWYFNSYVQALRDEYLADVLGADHEDKIDYGKHIDITEDLRARARAIDEMVVEHLNTRYRQETMLEDILDKFNQANKKGEPKDEK